MPKISHVKIKNKTGKHAYVCKTLRTPKTNMDLITCTSSGATNTPAAALLGQELQLRLKEINIKNSTLTNNTKINYKPSLFYNYSFNRYSELNIFEKSLLGNITTYFKNKSLNFLAKDKVFGYGDEIKVDANNVFTKGKKYTIEFFRTDSVSASLDEYDRNVMARTGFPQILWDIYDSASGRHMWATNQYVNANVELNYLGIKYTQSEPDHLDFEYPYNGDSNAYRINNVVKYLSDMNNFFSIFSSSTNGKEYIPLLDVSRSYLKSYIKIGYEFIYTDGSTETFLTEKANETTSPYYLGRFRVIFTPSKDIASVKFVVRFDGDFDYGKIYGNFKNLINNYYPGLSTAYRTFLKKVISDLDSVRYHSDTVYTSLEAYYAYLETPVNGLVRKYNKTVNGYPIAEMNPATGKVREVYSPLMVMLNATGEEKTLATEELTCALGIYNIALYETNDTDTIIEYVNEHPIVSMFSSNGSTPVNVKINNIEQNDNLFNLNMKDKSYPIFFKNLKTKKDIKTINNINSFILKNDIAGPGETAIRDYVFKYFLDTHWSYGGYNYDWWDIDNSAAQELYYEMNSLSLLSYIDVMFDKNKHRYLHLYLENMNIPNKSSLYFRVEYFFSEASRNHSGILTKHKPMGTFTFSANNRHGIIDNSGSYVTHTWVGYNRFDDESLLQEEIDVLSYKSDSYGIWNAGDLLELMHGHKVRMCIFVGKIDESTLNDHHRIDLVTTLSPSPTINMFDKKVSDTVSDLEVVYEQQEINSYDDYMENTSEPYIYVPTVPEGYYFNHSTNLEYYISGDKTNWYLAKNLDMNVSNIGNAFTPALTTANIPVTEEIEYASVPYKIEYKEKYYDKEDQSKHTLDLSFEDGQYSFKRYPEIFKEIVGSLADTFKSYTNFYFDTISFTKIEDMNKKHEWFRLFGIDRETDITDIITFNRKTKESMILINSIPIEFTKHKLLEYNDFEFIALYGDITITELGVLYSPEIAKDKDVDGIYINYKGEVNTDRDGILISASNNYVLCESGFNYIPKGYVCSDNIIMINAAKKVKKYTDRINFLNKIVVVPANMKAYVPIKRCDSMFEEICYRLNKYLIDSKTTDASTIAQLGTVAKNLHTAIYSISANLNKDFYDNTYLYPDLKTLIQENNPYPISADVETYLYQSNECIRNFVIEESKYDLVLYKNNPFGLDIKMPKFMIPYSNPKGYKPVLFMNGELLTASPEIYKKGSNEYAIVDVCDVYGKTYSDFQQSYEDCISWYRTNKVTATNEHVFEIELYPNDTKILETKCTKFNDNCVPIPLDFLEEIKVKGDYCYEVYLDGRLLHPYYYKLNLFSKKNDLSNTVNIPAIYFSKTMTTKMSIGSRVTVIKKKDIRVISYDISSYSSPILYNSKFNKYSKFYYSNGRKIPENRMIRLSPNVVLFIDLLNNSYKKTYNSLKDFTGSPFILVSNEIYDLSGSIVTHSKFSDDIYSSAVTYLYNIAPYDYYTGNQSYLNLTSDKVGTFLSDSDFDAYISMCKNSLKDSFTPPTFSDITKINTGTYKQSSGAVDFTNIDITQKVSYIYSLLVKSFISSRDINRFAETFEDIRLEDNSNVAAFFNKQPMYPDDETIAKYNYFVINHLGEASTVNKESFTSAVILNNDTPFKKYKSLVFIPVNYGILPKEWCKRSEPDNQNLPVVNNTYR